MMVRSLIAIVLVIMMFLLGHIWPENTVVYTVVISRAPAEHLHDLDELTGSHSIVSVDTFGTNENVDLWSIRMHTVNRNTWHPRYEQHVLKSEDIPEGPLNVFGVSISVKGSWTKPEKILIK